MHEGTGSIVHNILSLMLTLSSFLSVIFDLPLGLRVELISEKRKLVYQNGERLTLLVVFSEVLFSFLLKLTSVEILVSFRVYDVSA